MNTEKLRNWIANEISIEGEIIKLNRTFSDRYWKYRQRWLKNITLSRQPIPFLPLQKRFRPTNLSYRYPHLTAVDFVTEVADETAWGKFLRTCVHAHLKTNLSILKMLSSSNISVKKLYRRENEAHHFIWYRERPLVFKAKGKRRWARGEG